MHKHIKLFLIFLLLTSIKLITVISMSDINAYTIISNYDSVCLADIDTTSKYYLIPTSAKDVNLFCSASGGNMCKKLSIKDNHLCIENISLGHVRLVQVKNDGSQTFSITRNSFGKYTLSPVKKIFYRGAYYAIHLSIILSVVFVFVIIAIYTLSKVEIDKAFHTCYLTLDVVVSVMLLYFIQYKAAVKCIIGCF